ncbi:MAG: hypothetical protein SO386_01265, partial [Eubacteriales bacterium]|nr:hypothetical protein [Eubacteriales bacterium]
KNKSFKEVLGKTETSFLTKIEVFFFLTFSKNAPFQCAKKPRDPVKGAALGCVLAMKIDVLKLCFKK